MIGETFPGLYTDYKDRYEYKDSVTSFHATVGYWELFTTVVNQLNFENLLLRICKCLHNQFSGRLLICNTFIMS